MKTIGVFHDQAQAVVAKSLLDAHGMFALLPDWYHAANAWHMTFALQGIRLCVMDSDAEAAMELLRLSKGQDAIATRLTVQGGLIALLCFLVAGIPYPARWPVKTD